MRRWHEQRAWQTFQASKVGCEDMGVSGTAVEGERKNGGLDSFQISLVSNIGEDGNESSLP